MDKQPQQIDTVEPWLRLHHNQRISGRVALALLNKLKTPEAVLAASTDTLNRVLQFQLPSRSTLNRYDADAVARDQQWLSGRSHHLVTWNQSQYPPLLRQIPDPPILLYVKGDPGLLSQPQLAIVGSRNPTHNGIRTAYEFAHELCRCGFVITSGLAIGIDAAAHRGALDGGGKTVAVAATGLDQTYPRVHHQLANAISTSGTLASELPIGTAPRKAHFPRRNRLISGLSWGTLVIEAACRSGSLITARLAAEQGREVFAVPGSIHSPQAKGCHRLIRDGAKLTQSTTDVLEELGQFCRKQTHNDQRGSPGVAVKPMFEPLMAVIAHDPVTADVLIQRSGLTADTVSAMLLQMELEGIVATLPDGRYSLVG